MNRAEYLDTLAQQLRCKKAKDLVLTEITNHIEEQAEALEAGGMSRKAAMEEAIRQMGDPVETGIQLDRLHRPAMNWRMIGLIVSLSLLGLLVQFVAARFMIMPGNALHDMYNADLKFLWQRQFLFVIIGLLLMMVICFVDYSFLGRYPLLLYGIFLAGLAMGSFLGIFRVTNGQLGIYNILTLFLPLYGGVLYYFRGGGYGKLSLCLVFGVIPTWLTAVTTTTSRGLCIGLGCLLLLYLALYRGWFGIGRRACAIIAISLIGLPFLAFLSAVFWGCPIWGLQEYQIDRLQAILRMFTGNEGDYMTAFIREVLQNTHLWGAADMTLTGTPVTAGLLSLNSDYIILFLFARYGILAGTAALGLLALLLVSSFRMALRQKNQLGMMIGCSCSLMLSVQGINYALSNLGLIPLSPGTLPFFSYGVQNALVTYTMMGLILGIYRYKDVLSDKAIRRNVWKLQFVRQGDGL